MCTNVHPKAEKVSDVLFAICSQNIIRIQGEMRGKRYERRYEAEVVG